MRSEILRLERINCRQDNKMLLKSARLNVLDAEVIGVVGMNYSGKSTLVGVAAGLTTQYEGCVVYLGKKQIITSPEHANRLGIFYVQPKSMLIERLTIEENMLIAPDKGGDMLVNRARSRTAIEQLFTQLGLWFRLDTPVAGLSFYQKFLIELARGVLCGARLIFIDSMLDGFSQQMLEQLKALFRSLSAMGVSLVLVDSGIRYLKPYCARVFVMRKGMMVGVLDRENLNEDTVVSMMLGYDMRSLKRPFPEQPSESSPGDVLMRWRNVRYKNVLHSLSFDVLSGEVVGLLNINKSSGDAVAEILTDAEDDVYGEILMRGERLRLLTAESTRKLGVAVMPAESPVFPNLTLDENISIAALRLHSRMGLFFNRRALRFEMNELIDEFLSGNAPLHTTREGMPGNRFFLRKVALCRTLISHPHLIVWMHPTLNMDDLMAAEIIGDVQKVRKKGIAQLIISTDAEFLLLVCNRILIVNYGTVERAFTITAASRDELLRQYGRSLKDL